MNNKIKAAYKSARFIIILNILNRLLGLFKETTIASKLGCCFETDAYFTAVAASAFLAEILGEGLTTSMVPILLKIEEREGSWRKSDYINNLIHITIIVSLGLILGSWLFAPLVIRIFASGFTGEELAATTRLMRLGLPVISFIMIRSIFGGYLQSYHAFRAGAKSWLYYNGILLVYLLALNRYGVYGLILAGILASAGQMVSMIPAARDYGYSYKRIVDLKNPYIRELGVMIMPIVIGIFINKLNLVIDKSIASSLETGAISWLNYANEIIQLVLGIFITAIVTVLFPIISQEYNRENIESLKATMVRGSRIILAIALPLSLVLGLLSRPLVSLLYERGEFTARSGLVTSAVLSYYALGLTSMALLLILTRIHYAMHDSLTPMIYGGIGVVTNLVLSIGLSVYMGTPGIALATSISTSLVILLLVRDLNTRLRVIDLGEGKTYILKLLASLGLMALVVLVGRKWTRDFQAIGDLGRLALPGLVGLVSYSLGYFKFFDLDKD